MARLMVGGTATTPRNPNSAMLVYMGMSTSQRDAEFTEFVEHHAGALRHTALLLSASPTAAEDLLQDALVRVWLSWDRVEHATARAYARRVLVNLATDRWRGRKYRPDPVALEDWRPDPSASAAFANVEDRAFVIRQLAQLSARERAMVVLRYYADMSEADVADHLGVSVGTVKSTCSRALARLRSRAEAAEATRSLR